MASFLIFDENAHAVRNPDTTSVEMVSDGYLVHVAESPIDAVRRTGMVGTFEVYLLPERPVVVTANRPETPPIEYEQT